MDIKDSSELKKLILERPDLEIVPFCTEECGGEYGSTMGEFMRCSIEKIAYPAPWDEERVMMKSEDFDYYHDWRWGNDEELSCPEELDDAEVEQSIKDDYEKFDWKECIVVWIDGFFG